MRTNTGKKLNIIITTLAMAAIITLAGCGGGGAQAPTQSGNGKVAATVRLTGLVGGRFVADSATATVNVSIMISGVYSETNTEFPPVTTTYPVNIAQGYAHVSVVNVPIGVNHLLTAVADWGGSVETVKAIIPKVTEDETVTVTADAESTVVANTAIYYAKQHNIPLADVESDTIASIGSAVAAYAVQVPYANMTPENVLVFIQGMNMPTRIDVSPASATIVIGGTMQFTAHLYDANNTAMPASSVIWSSSPSGIGSINNVGGLFTAVAAGSGTITASYLQLNAAVPITVVSVCKTDTDCNDGLPLTLDACNNPGTLNGFCSYTPTACITNADCNDNQSLTIDTCLSGGTATATCSNVMFECNDALDCDDSDTLTIDTCANGGTATAVCAHITYPTVTSVVPVDNAVGAALNTSITAIFSETMDRATITTKSFTLTQGATPVSGTVTYSGVTAVFTPNSNLTGSTLYTATITTGAANLSGNGLAASKAWTFTTGAAPDTTSPTVTSVVPVDIAVGAALNTTVTAIFSETMDPATITTVSFTLKQGTTPVSGTVTYSGLTAVFTPNINLTGNTLYTATISTVAMDLAGNTLAASKVWTFTTGAAPDTTSPTVTSVVPVDNAVGATLNTSITAIFSETMDPATITTVSFTLMQGTTPVSGTVTYSDVTAVFMPNSDLTANTLFTATISTVATDLAGNALAASKVWTFTTGAAPDTTRPSVIITTPGDGDSNVHLNKTITASFSEAMDSATITTVSFALTQGLTPVSGTVTYTGATATFTPSSDLSANTLYTATITSAAMDLAGNQLGGNQGTLPAASDYVWTFTTGAGLDQTPVVLGSCSNFAILASAAIVNIPTSIVTGDIGLTPDTGSNISGFSVPATCPEVNGTVYAVDAAGPACVTIDPVLLLAAKSDAALAFTDAMSSVRGTPTAMSGDINGLTLYPGLYESGTSIEISPGGIVYMDAQGDSNAIFIIRSATTITTSATSQVILTNGAKANNIYWTAGSAVSLGMNSTMKGTVIAGTGISMLTGANLEGRLLNQGAAAAAITLDTSTITVPSP